MDRARRIGWLLAWGSLCWTAAAIRADGPKKPVAKPPLVIAAKVAGQPIYVAEVTEELDGALKGRAVEDDNRPRMLAQMLGQLVDRRLVLEYLRGRSQAVDKIKVEAQVAQLTAELKQHGTTLPAYLAARGITDAALREQIAWRLSWKGYVQRHVNDAVLERYFDSHRREYDGTQVRASQILLPLPKDADASALEAVRKQAADLRKQIVAGNLSFDDAATKHSTAPSKQQRGDLGWIARHGAVPERVATVAFALEVGQVSEPVVTPFGVHLVKVTEIKPGGKTWRDVAEELQSVIVRRGFAKIAAEQRGKSQIEFTGATPYFDPKTGKLKL
ncbi:MAG: peptidylprolyl isomerase [Planctomycetes bacterium]|nr:peptidylprolyl isomerase [Planctomycetota bacterium]